MGVIVPLQIFQYHKYATFWNYLVDPLIIYWNQDQWNAFPDDIKKGIMEAAQEAGKFEIALCRAGLDGDKSVNILKNDFNFTMEVPDPVKWLESKGMTVDFFGRQAGGSFQGGYQAVSKVVQGNR